VRELGHIKIAAFAAESELEGGEEADIVVYGKGSEGDGTKPIP